MLSKKFYPDRRPTRFLKPRRSFIAWTRWRSVMLSLSKHIQLLFLLSLFIQSCSTFHQAENTNHEPQTTNRTTQTSPEKISSKPTTQLSSSDDSLKEQVKILVSDDASVKKNLLLKKYATILHVKTSDLQNENLYAVIDEWWGVHYKYGGNSKTGIDCSGFVCMLLKNIYAVELTRGSRAMYDETEHVKKDELQEGDLVFFKIKKGRVSHVGMYLTNNYFVHASVRSGVTISSLDDDYYKKVFACGGRWRK